MVTQRKWAGETFVRTACDVLSQHIAWGTIDSGCLDRATSLAVSIDGQKVVVGVLENVDLLPEVLAHAKDARASREAWSDAPLWLYVPQSAVLPDVAATVRRVALPAPDEQPLARSFLGQVLIGWATLFVFSVLSIPRDEFSARATTGSWLAAHAANGLVGALIGVPVLRFGNSIRRVTKSETARTLGIFGACILLLALAVFAMFLYSEWKLASSR